MLNSRYIQDTPPTLGNPITPSDLGSQGIERNKEDYLSTLPPELIDEIAKYLNYDDIKNLSQNARYLRESTKYPLSKFKKKYYIESSIPEHLKKLELWNSIEINKIRQKERIRDILTVVRFSVPTLGSILGILSASTLIIATSPQFAQSFSLALLLALPEFQILLGISALAAIAIMVGTYCITKPLSTEYRKELASHNTFYAVRKQALLKGSGETYDKGALDAITLNEEAIHNEYQQFLAEKKRWQDAGETAKGIEELMDRKGWSHWYTFERMHRVLLKTAQEHQLTAPTALDTLSATLFFLENADTQRAAIEKKYDTKSSQLEWSDKKECFLRTLTRTAMWLVVGTPGAALGSLCAIGIFQPNVMSAFTYALFFSALSTQIIFAVALIAVISASLLMYNALRYNNDSYQKGMDELKSDFKEHSIGCTEEQWIKNEIDENERTPLTDLCGFEKRKGLGFFSVDKPSECPDNPHGPLAQP